MSNRYTRKQAERNKLPFTRVKRVYIGDFDTYLEDTGSGTYRLCTPSSTITVGSDGKVDFNKEMKIDGIKLGLHYYPFIDGSELKGQFDDVKLSYETHSGNSDLHFEKGEIDLDDLKNVDPIGKGINEFLIWDGDAWVPSAMTDSFLDQDTADTLYAPSANYLTEAEADVLYAPSGVTSNPIKYFNAVQISGGKELNAFTSIPWESEIKKDDCYTFTEGSGEITVVEDGQYKINYNVTVKNTGTSLLYPVSRVRYYSGSAWHIPPGSYSACFLNRVIGVPGTMSATLLLNLASGNLIEVQVEGGSTDVVSYPSGSSIFLEKI